MPNRRILLKDILGFDNFQEQFPGKRIKLRFNNDWSYKEEGVKIKFNQIQEYRISKCLEGTLFYQYLYSSYNDSGTKKRLNKYDILFQFMKMEWGSWLLIDVRKIIDPDGCRHMDGWKYAQAESVPEYEPLLGRVVVEKPGVGRTWHIVKRGIIDTIIVKEILPVAFLDRTETFGGYDSICKTYKDLSIIINNKEWWDALSSIYGIYVITDIATGKQYVGSAYGDNGVAGRWQVYIDRGYDKDERETNGNIEYPNKKLKALVNKKGKDYVRNNFQYTLLEIFSKDERGRRKVLERESYWKDVLQTRRFGYNDN